MPAAPVGLRVLLSPGGSLFPSGSIYPGDGVSAAGQSSASLALTFPARVALDLAAATSTAALVLMAPLGLRWLPHTGSHWPFVPASGWQHTDGLVWAASAGSRWDMDPQGRW